jgi:hypothetical protein
LSVYFDLLVGLPVSEYVMELGLFVGFEARNQQKEISVLVSSQLKRIPELMASRCEMYYVG